MGQTGFCKHLRFSAKVLGFLRFPAVFCENLRLRNAKSVFSPSLWRVSPLDVGLQYVEHLGVGVISAA